MKKYIALWCLPFIMSATLIAADAEQANNDVATQAAKTPLQQVVDFVNEQQIRFLQLEFSDIHGTPKSYTITASMIPSAITEGVKFDGSSVAGYTAISESDMLLVPDLATMRVLPWTNGELKTAMIICEVAFPDGKPCMSCPRTILRATADKLRARGYVLNASPEIEFFMTKKGDDDLDGKDYCAYASTDETNFIKLTMLNALEMMGLQPEKTHHEVAPSQHEMTLRYRDALTMADNYLITRNVIATIAQMSGYEVSFMPKPLPGENGSGLHINYSLQNISDGSNAFFDKDDKNFLSPLAKKFIAGNLAHAKALAGITNPTLNSYKRLVPGFEAPINVCWGSENRSAMIRIPSVMANQKHAVRAEMRNPDPQTNPYLAFAAIAATGLDGIDKNMELMPETEENVYNMSTATRNACNIDTLPSSLAQSIEELKNDATLNELLGSTIMKTYCDIKDAQAHGAQAAH